MNLNLKEPEFDLRNELRQILGDEFDLNDLNLELFTNNKTYNEDNYNNNIGWKV